MSIFDELTEAQRTALRDGLAQAAERRGAPNYTVTAILDEVFGPGESAPTPEKDADEYVAGVRFPGGHVSRDTGNKALHHAFLAGVNMARQRLIDEDEQDY